MINRLLLILLTLFMAACSDTNQDSSNVFETQVNSIEKAEEVEQQILDAAQRQRQQIEEDINP